MSIREEGFYWVQRDAGIRGAVEIETFVAQWQDGQWWMAGNEQPFEDSRFDVISEKLHRPILDAWPQLLWTNDGGCILLRADGTQVTYTLAEFNAKINEIAEAESPIRNDQPTQ